MKTLPVILGERWSRACVVVMVLLQYVLCLGLVIANIYGWPLLLVLPSALFLPRLLRAFGAPKPEKPPAAYPEQVWPLWFSAHAFAHTRWFTSLFLLALLVETALR